MFKLLDSLKLQRITNIKMLQSGTVLISHPKGLSNEWNQMGLVYENVLGEEWALHSIGGKRIDLAGQKVGETI